MELKVANSDVTLLSAGFICVRSLARACLCAPVLACAYVCVYVHLRLRAFVRVY